MEAMKSAVQYGLGAAFVSSAAIVKEMELGLFKRLDISGVRLMRTLSLVSSWHIMITPKTKLFLEPRCPGSLRRFKRVF